MKIFFKQFLLPIKWLTDTWLLFLFFLTAVFAIALNNLHPNIHNGSYRLYESQVSTFIDYPFSVPTEPNVSVEINWQMNWSKYRPVVYKITIDDCLNEFYINNVLYTDTELPYCNYFKDLRLDLTSYLQPGVNTFSAVVYNYGGTAQVNITESFTDMIALFIYSLFYGSLLLFLWQITSYKLFKIYNNMFVRIVSILAIALRVFYVNFTPYTVREHDTEGHINYINILMDAPFSLPSFTDGWVTYHPPLYYWLVSFIGRLARMYIHSSEMFFYSIQLVSLTLSVLTFMISVWIANLLFTHKEKSKQYLFITFSAVFTSFIYVSSRINNDTLLATLTILCFAFCLQWWNKKQIVYWYIAILIACLSILTKNNGLLLLPILIGSLCFFKQSWQKIVVHICIAVTIISISTGWFFYIRIQEGATKIVANAHWLDPVMKISNSYENFIYFNPIRLVIHPYRQMAVDRPETGYFFENLFQSAYFYVYLEDRLKIIASTIMFMATVLLLYLFKGIYSVAIKSFYKRIPLFTCFIILMIGHIFIRIQTPYQPIQEFRYSYLLMVPITYFTIEGIYSSNKYLKILGLICFVILVVAQVLFIFGLSL